MPREQIVRRVPHEAGAMYDLVADVERYPEFLPGCRKLKVLSRVREGEAEILIAELTVGYKLITERFTCRVRLDREALAIDGEYIEGPLSHLVNLWRFRDLPQGGSEIDFTIDFEIRNRGLGLLVGTLFDKVFRRFVDAFEARANAMKRRAPGGRGASATAVPQ